MHGPDAHVTNLSKKRFLVIEDEADTAVVRDAGLRR
jgi:hypothetical protein